MMRPIQLLLIATILIGTACLAVSFMLMGTWPAAVGLAVFGLLWIAFTNRLHWFSTVALILDFGAAAVSIRLGAPQILVIVGAIVILSAWDLDRLMARLQMAETRQVDIIMKRHLIALGVVDGAALLIGFISTTATLHLSFAALFFLGLIAVTCLTLAIRWMMPAKTEDPDQP